MENESKTARYADIEQSYFSRAISPDGHKPTKYDKHSGANFATINAVYNEALTRFPEAADVIAALVFWRQIEFNRNAFLREQNIKYQEQTP